ncbi:MAG: 50S ribosome-binding GTPase, partial [Actinobacteria bacterium]|nr:50S ribosome-binding GTPase [Actinomycetota bacterium]
GEERVLVDSQADTTRDTIDTVVELGDTTYRFIDTAGLRRPGKLSENIEYYSRVRALAALEKAQVALILIDTTVGLTDYDLTIIDEAMKRRCAAAILLNKWDEQTMNLQDLKYKLARKTTLKPPYLATSALTGRGVKDILPLVRHLHDLYTSRISTRELNKVLQDIKSAHSPPIIRGRQLKMYYISQPAESPPKIVVQVNNKGLVQKPYAMYLENELRERFGYHGCPLVIEFRGKKS